VTGPVNIEPTNSGSMSGVTLAGSSGDYYLQVGATGTYLVSWSLAYSSAASSPTVDVTVNNTATPTGWATTIEGTAGNASEQVILSLSSGDKLRLQLATGTLQDDTAYLTVLKLS